MSANTAQSSIMDKSSIEKLAEKEGIPEEQLLALARKTFGSIGGKAGTGKSKRRSPEHYKAMVEARKAKRESEKKQ